MHLLKKKKSYKIKYCINKWNREKLLVYYEKRGC